MTAQTEISPSSASALLLRLVSWLFKLGGSLFVLMALFSLAPVAMRLPHNPDEPSYWVTFVIAAAFGIALIGIGMLLARRSRIGALLALVINLYPLAFVLSGERPLHWTDVVISLSTIAVIASVWPLLSWQTRPARLP
jgi:hypothetical protein